MTLMPETIKISLSDGYFQEKSHTKALKMPGKEGWHFENAF